VRLSLVNERIGWGAYGPPPDSSRKEPFRSVPISAYPPSELALPFDEKLKPSSDPEQVPSARAGANWPRKASAGEPPDPAPRETTGPVARHWTSRLAVAGFPIVPSGDGVPNKVYDSTSGTPSACRRAFLPFPLIEKDPGGSAAVQKRPLGKMPPLMS
jgi:hypothetical protein